MATDNNPNAPLGNRGDGQEGDISLENREREVSRDRQQRQRGGQQNERGQDRHIEKEPEITGTDMSQQVEREQERQRELDPHLARDNPKDRNMSSDREREDHNRALRSPEVARAMEEQALAEQQRREALREAFRDNPRDGINSAIAGGATGREAREAARGVERDRDLELNRAGISRDLRDERGRPLSQAEQDQRVNPRDMHGRSAEERDVYSRFDRQEAANYRDQSRSLDGQQAAMERSDDPATRAAARDMGAREEQAANMATLHEREARFNEAEAGRMDKLSENPEQQSFKDYYNEQDERELAERDPVEASARQDARDDVQVGGRDQSPQEPQAAARPGADRAAAVAARTPISPASRAQMAATSGIAKPGRATRSHARALSGRQAPGRGRTGLGRSMPGRAQASRSFNARRLNQQRRTPQRTAGRGR